MEAIGRYDLRLSEEEFWDLHQNQFQAMHLRHLMSLAPLAHLTSIYVNAHQGDEAHKTTALDFIPGLRRKEPAEQTPEVRAIFEQLAIDQTMDRLKSIERAKQLENQH